MPQSEVIGFVMAGGEGQRLRPFTEAMPKPALPFAGGNRVIDFALSNLYNSRIRSLFVLMQYRPQVLLNHLAENWAFTDIKAGEFIEPVLPVSDGLTHRFRGTADAVHQSLDLLEGCRADLVAVFAADHVYRMDVRQMVDFHETRDADTTVVALPVPVEQACDFGVIEAEASGRIRGFQEKPSDPAPMPGDPHRCFASMGNYLFRPDVLRRALAETFARGEHDFGRHVLPRLIVTNRVYAYDFSTNVVPGTRSYEEPAYWRDIGTVDAYVAAHWDMLGPQPRFCLDNPQWPILCGNGKRSVYPLDGDDVVDSILDLESSCEGASMRHSVLQRGACVEAGATIEDCVIMNGARVKRGAHLRRVIVGPGNTLDAGASIGYDADADREHYAVTRGGVVVVPPRAVERRAVPAL
jgi:glucose-1-phosphate adenylyltransferase